MLEIPRKKVERAVIVGVQLGAESDWDAQQNLYELEQLVDTAGAAVVGKSLQHRDKPHVRTYIGPGKAEEIAQLVRAQQADLVVMDVDLSPSQQRNLEDIFNKQVVDRTGIILDIFAQHAHSAEGKLQVELAQLNYLLPRLRGMWQHLAKERLGGGRMSDRIGTRGPGETQLETDRRLMRKRIQRLTHELEEVKQNRATQRKQRQRLNIYSVALVGYTNAGKSTLLNALTGADALVEDKLFATLDSTTRKLSLDHHKREIVLSDTVGFIRKLPHQLVAAFRSTLDEVLLADLLLHVVDASHPKLDSQITAVEDVLKELEADSKPQLLVFNKIDLIDENDVERLRKVYPNSVMVSAQQQQGLEGLREAIEEVIRKSSTRVHLLIPYSQGKLLQRLYSMALIISEDHTEKGTEIVADVPARDVVDYEEYAI